MLTKALTAANTMNDDIINLTKKLIEIQSTSDHHEQLHQIIGLVQTELANFHVQKFESNGFPSLLFSNTGKATQKFKLLLNAHLDVVPGRTEQFQPYEQDGRLYGRGTADMKSATAAMIISFKQLANQVDYPLGLQIVMDEEQGGLNGTKYQIDQGINAEFVLGGDIPELKINNEAKGVYYIKLHAQGIAAHSAYPWRGENAAVFISQAIHKLHELLPVPEKETWESTASVIKIETDNNTVNTIADNCTAYINIRYIPEETKDILKELRSLIPSQVSLEEIFSVPPEYTSPQHPYVLKLKDSMEKILGEPAKFLSSHAQSDLRYYHMIGTPAVNLGPTGSNHHGVDEWVDLKSIEDYTEILKDFILTANML